MTARRPSRARLALLMVLVLVGGCGVGGESTAHRVAPEDVPFELLDDPATAPNPSRSGVTDTVFLFADDRLVPVERSSSADLTIVDLVDLIADGPTEAERTLGLSSALPADQVREVVVARGVAQVDLAGTFADLNGRDQARAIAQLTFTLTGQPGVGRVGFTLEGTPTEVPRGDGSLTADAVAREDFESVAPAS